MNIRTNETKQSASYPRAFWISLIAVFCMACIHYLGVQAFQFLTPLSARPDIFPTILPHLQQKINHYQLHHSSTAGSRTTTMSDYDSAASYAVVDYENGSVLFQKNEDAQVTFASFT